MRWIIIAGGAALSVLAYVKLARPRIVDWHATTEESARSMPGDDLIPDATLRTTHAIMVNAPPSAIWPWLLQMGPCPRGGIYTYDWLERRLGIDIENADRIMPEFQHLEPGEVMGLNDGEGIRVVDVREESAIVLQWVPAGSSWTFGLYPQSDGTTRLISRNRIKPKNALAWAGMVGFREPGRW
jgi:hypothetical protein